MHAAAIVARVLEPCLAGMHAKRATACVRAVEALVLGGALSLSALAWRLRAATSYRHRVKSIDRLLGNCGLHASRHSVYAELARGWLAGLQQLLLVVDWSDVTPDQKWHCLRASVAVEGRSITLYEEVHPQRQLGNPQVQRAFIARIARLLPPGCTPIVMTDAGFRSPWFREIAARGWAFVGRIRGRDMVRCAAGCWIRATSLYSQATEQAQSLGAYSYVRRNPLDVRLVLVKLPPAGRHQRNIYGRRRRAGKSKKCARAAKQPWLLATSPNLAHLAAVSVVRLYAQRMRIEQSFRDTKNLRFGLGMSITRSRSRERLQVLLLLGHLANFVQRLIGEQAKAYQLQLQFMATRRKDRPEISTLTLARRILLSHSPAHWLTQLAPWAAIPLLRQQTIDACAV